MEITLLNATAHNKFDNNLFPELPNYIIHRINSNPNVASLYFREHITYEYILLNIVSDIDFINNEITENLIINKIIEIVEEGKIYA